MRPEVKTSKPVISCPLCGESAVTWLGARLPAQEPANLLVFGSSRPGVRARPLLRCSACGLGWQDPLPPRDELLATYRSMRDPVYESEERGRRRAQQSLFRLIRSGAGADGRTRLLDVGCGIGLFLDLARREGWDVWGVEPSVALATRARASHGDRIVNAAFEEAAFGDRRFEVVTMWDVLEHLSDPRAALERAAGLLTPGGRLALKVPNRQSLIARALGRRWPLLLPEHLHYFSPKSLRQLLESAGLTSSRAHLHVVHFSLKYVLHRCAQHGLPGAGPARRVVLRRPLARLTVPLLLGELAVVARAPGHEGPSPSPPTAGS